MSLKSQPRNDAEAFIEKIKRLFASEEGLIYGIDADVKHPNVISVETAGAYDAWFEATLYNVGDPYEALHPRKWARLGELDADFGTNDGGHYNGYNPLITITKRFTHE